MGTKGKLTREMWERTSQRLLAIYNDMPEKQRSWGKVATRIQRSGNGNFNRGYLNAVANFKRKPNPRLLKVWFIQPKGIPRPDRRMERIRQALLICFLLFILEQKGITWEE